MASQYELLLPLLLTTHIFPSNADQSYGELQKFTLITKSVTKPLAENACNFYDGSTLASIHSERDQAELQSLYSSYSSTSTSTDLWLGLTTSNNEYHWDDGTSFDWGTNKLFSSGNADNLCVRADGTFWYTTNCSESHYVLCNAPSTLSIPSDWTILSGSAVFDDSNGFTQNPTGTDLEMVMPFNQWFNGNASLRIQYTFSLDFNGNNVGGYSAVRIYNDEFDGDDTFCNSYLIGVEQTASNSNSGPNSGPNSFSFSLSLSHEKYESLTSLAAVDISIEENVYYMLDIEVMDIFEESLKGNRIRLQTKQFIISLNDEPYIAYNDTMNGETSWTWKSAVDSYALSGYIGLYSNSKVITTAKALFISGVMANSSSSLNISSDCTTDFPTNYPSLFPTAMPSEKPTPSPTPHPTKSPTKRPTVFPTGSPSEIPSVVPTVTPTMNPTVDPTVDPPTLIATGTSSTMSRSQDVDLNGSVDNEHDGTIGVDTADNDEDTDTSDSESDDDDDTSLDSDSIEYIYEVDNGNSVRAQLEEHVTESVIIAVIICIICVCCLCAGVIVIGMCLFSRAKRKAKVSEDTVSETITTQRRALQKKTSFKTKRKESRENTKSHSGYTGMGSKVSDLDLLVIANEGRVATGDGDGDEDHDHDLDDDDGDTDETDGTDTGDDDTITDTERERSLEDMYNTYTIPGVHPGVSSRTPGPAYDDDHHYRGRQAVIPKQSEITEVDGHMVGTVEESVVPLDD